MKKRFLVSILCLLAFNIITLAQTQKSVDEVKGIPIGTNITMFSATDADGNTYKLKEALTKGPVVVVFYRGQWCPVCNRHLSNLQDSLQLIYAKGASVIAISPEKPALLATTRKKTKATFTLLHDKDFIIGEMFDVVFDPDKKLVSIYNDKLKANLDTASSDGSNRLPVPATYIINKDGVVVWKQFNPDYTKRASVLEIIKYIPAR